MTKSNHTKNTQLGMPYGTACNKLKKDLLFNFAQRLGLDSCHQCGEKIATPDELSIEHKTPFLHSDNPVKLFFNLNNIAFSHQSCNSKASRRVPGKKKHPSISAYGRGCRCKECTSIARASVYRSRERRGLTKGGRKT